MKPQKGAHNETTRNELRRPSRRSLASHPESLRMSNGDERCRAPLHHRFHGVNEPERWPNHNYLCDEGVGGVGPFEGFGVVVAVGDEGEHFGDEVVS